jgi:flagellar basal body-associated protein FliL
VKSKKVMIILPVALLLVVFMAYTMFLKPKPVAPKKKIEGMVVPLQKEFLVNLAGGRYAKVSVALVMEGAGAATEGATGRAVVTDELTGLPADDLVGREARHRVVEQIRKGIMKHTDEEVGEVLLTDITVQ